MPVVSNAENIEYTAAWPFLAPKSPSLLMQHFDTTVYNVDASSHLYRFVDAICGESGAGDLRKQYLLSRLGSSADGVHFGDLDCIFNNLLSIPRLDVESYTYNPYSDMLTSDQWDEVYVKDAWYRARAKNFLAACQAGGTNEGFSLMVSSVTGGTCDIYETWRFEDQPVGRLPIYLRNEVVVSPHKSSLTHKEKSLLLHHLDRIKPMDVVVTIDPNGLAVHLPVAFRQVSADSSYFEVQKFVTNNTDFSKIPPPEYLAEDIFAGEDWLLQSGPQEAPTTALNSAQEYSYFYKFSSSGEGQIDEVDYMKEDLNGLSLEVNYSTSQTSSSWGPWMGYPLGDSPDNFPGGQNGVTPFTEPAISLSGQPYVFLFTSQEDFVTEMRGYLVGQGAETTVTQYRLPIGGVNTSRSTYSPDMSVPTEVPMSGNTLISGWYSGRQGTSSQPSNIGTE